MSHTVNRFVALVALSLLMTVPTPLVKKISSAKARAENAAPSPRTSVVPSQAEAALPQAYTNPNPVPAAMVRPVPQVDLRVMAAKLVAANSLLHQVWGDAFYQRGLRYAPPRLQAYYSPLMTGCGRIPLGNASYCAADHAIYFDVNFFASEMARAGQDSGTDGDMAPIVILAHEWGHAVQRMAGITNNYESPELQADCLAGAFVRATAQYLEPGDLEEATFSLRAAGDDAWSYRHGTGSERVNSFARGLQGGAGVCGMR